MRSGAVRVGIGGLLVGCLVLAGCGDPKPSSPTMADLGKIDLSPDHTIIVTDDGFEPAELQIESGDVVLLRNEGTGLHSFTAVERFDTGRLHPGDSTTMVLTKPGEIPYSDLESPNRKATITVVEASP